MMAVRLPFGWLIGFNVETEVTKPPGFEALFIVGRHNNPGRWWRGNAVLFGLGWDADMPLSALPRVNVRTRWLGHRVWTFTWFGLCLILCRGVR